MSGSKFSSEVPKGDAWGVEDALDRAAAEFEDTGHSPMIPVIGVMGIKEIKLVPGDDGPTRQIVAKLFRVNALTTAAAINEGQKLILKALADAQGRTDSPTLPFESQQILDMAFGRTTPADADQDEAEARIDESLDDPARLPRHLASVHGHDYDDVMRMEWVDVRTLHDSDHDRPDTDGMPPHDRDWWAWRRVDLQAAESEADETPQEPSPDGEVAADLDPADNDPGDDDDAPADNVTPLFAHGGAGRD